MRRFIYLDTDTLNSYLAQIFDGVIQSQETEKSFGKKKEKQNRLANSIGGQIAFKLFGKGVDANAQATYEHLKTVANDEMVRDVQTKIMHDNAFDEFASYLKENNLLTGTEIGNFVSIEDDFYIFDIAFFQKLFSAGGFVSGIKEIQKSNFQKEAEKKVQELPREQQRSKNLQRQIKEMVDAATSKNEEEFKAAESLINMLASIPKFCAYLTILLYLMRNICEMIYLLPHSSTEVKLKLLGISQTRLQHKVTRIFPLLQVSEIQLIRL